MMTVGDEIKEMLFAKTKHGIRPTNMYIGHETFARLCKERFMPTTIDYDLTQKRYQAYGLWVYKVDAEEHLFLG
jgi:hypothetical protein